MSLQKWTSHAFVAFVLAVNSQVVFASSLSNQNNSVSSLWTNTAQIIQSSWVATLSFGPSWESAGKTQAFYLTPDIEKAYVANQSRDFLANAEFFLGLQGALQQNIQGQLGFELAYTGNASLSGDIWDDADPNFDNYTYKYNIQHTHIALKGKLLGDWELPFEPWVSAALGVGLNKSYDFSNTPTIFAATPMPNFISHTTTALTYTLGVGLERELIKHWKVGIGYEFADWGKSRLSRAPGQSLNSSLSLSHLYTGSMLLNITYQA